MQSGDACPGRTQDSVAGAVAPWARGGPRQSLARPFLDRMSPPSAPCAARPHSGLSSPPILVGRRRLLQSRPETLRQDGVAANLPAPGPGWGYPGKSRTRHARRHPGNTRPPILEDQRAPPPPQSFPADSCRPSEPVPRQNQHQPAGCPQHTHTTPPPPPPPSTTAPPARCRPGGRGRGHGEPAGAEVRRPAPSPPAPPVRPARSSSGPGRAERTSPGAGPSCRAARRGEGGEAAGGPAGPGPPGPGRPLPARQPPPGRTPGPGLPRDRRRSGRECPSPPRRGLLGQAGRPGSTWQACPSPPGAAQAPCPPPLSSSSGPRERTRGPGSLVVVLVTPPAAATAVVRCAGDL